VSGIYELEPLIGTSINRALRLTADAARVLSPMLAPLQGFPPGIVCWGELETCEFERQSLAFAARLRRAGTACEVFKVPRRNHFDVILDLADADTALGAATIALVRSI
jgi:arylformamidase